MESTPFTRTIDLELLDGARIKVEITATGREDVALNSQKFEDFLLSLDRIAESLYATLTKSQATKTTLKFGAELGSESDQLTTLIVKGRAKGNFDRYLNFQLRQPF